MRKTISSFFRKNVDDLWTKFNDNAYLVESLVQKFEHKRYLLLSLRGIQEKISTLPFMSKQDFTPQKLLTPEIEKNVPAQLISYLRACARTSTHFRPLCTPEYLTADNLRYLSAFLQNNVTFHSLDLSGLSLDEPQLTLLLVGMKEMVNLRDLNLSRNTFGNPGVRKLATFFRRTCVDVRKLDLSYTKSFDANGILAIQTILKHSRALRDLNLSGNEINSSEAAVDGLMRSVGENKLLRKLDISSMGICDASAESVALMLRLNESLASLKLNKNNLTLKGLVKIGQELQNNPRITCLEVAFNPVKLSGDSVKDFCLFMGYLNKDVLEQLSLSADFQKENVNHVWEFLVGNTTIRTLKFGGFVNAKGMAMMCNEIARNESLRKIKFHGMFKFQHDCGLPEFFRMLRNNDSIETYDLGALRLGAEMGKIGKILRRKPNVRVVKISNFDIPQSSKKRCKALGELVGKSGSLAKMQVNENMFQFMDFETLMKSLLNNDSLREIHFARNKIIFEQAIDVLKLFVAANTVPRSISLEANVGYDETAKLRLAKLMNCEPSCAVDLKNLKIPASRDLFLSCKFEQEMMAGKNFAEVMKRDRQNLGNVERRVNDDIANLQKHFETHLERYKKMYMQRYKIATREEVEDNNESTLSLLHSSRELEEDYDTESNISFMTSVESQGVDSSSFLSTASSYMSDVSSATKSPRYYSSKKRMSMRKILTLKRLKQMNKERRGGDTPIFHRRRASESGLLGRILTSPFKRKKMENQEEEGEGDEKKMEENKKDEINNTGEKKMKTF